MEMCGQLHALPALPQGKDSPTSIVGEAQRLSRRYGEEINSCPCQK
jgi:hypothetical protein